LSATISALAVQTTVSASGLGMAMLFASTKAKIALAVGVVLVGGLAVLLWPGRSGSTVTAAVATNINAVPSTSMKIRLTSVPVNDQDQALQFYTQVLGFVKKQDVPMGASRWLTVVPPTEPDGVELLLEPMGFAPARAFQAALFRARIPRTAFQADDVQREYDRMTKLGARFASPPTKYGPTTIAVFEDTCGNRIQLIEQPDKRPSATPGIRLKLISVSVPNQEQALRFYTEVLGFVKKTDEPVDGARWLTVVSPEEPDGAELLLEPLGFASARTYQKALFDAGIPATSFLVADVAKHHDRLVKLSVRFHTKPTQTGPTHIAVLDDTCGNLIQIFQP